MNARSRFGLISLALLTVLLLSSFVLTRQVQANTRINVGISVFHDALAPYGNWVNHRTYGQVWYPRGIAYDWRPYTDGYWAHTYEYGWLWVSYQPWGWAPFHYGRWAWDNWYGWIWVPGRTWAPAWVFWRSGGGYAAWAPMPPNVVWQPGIGLNISYFNYDRDLRWDSWVAVREYDLPHRHISNRIFAPYMNPQIIHVTNYINNVTIVNNTIVNQGVPVKQIEVLTGKPVVSIVPTVLNQVDVKIAEHNEGQPNIIRPLIAAPTPEEIHHNEELARRLDGKNPDGSRTELPSVVNSERSNNHKPRVPGRLVGAPAPVQSPYATPEQQNPVLTEPAGQTLPLPAIPETPLVGLGLDSDSKNKENQGGRKQKIRVSAQPQVDAAPVPPMQNELQQEATHRQDKQNQQQMDIQSQQTESTGKESRQMRQQDAARQQELQDQQQMEAQQQQQAERAREEERQMRQQEAARQQEIQDQQQMEVQQQQTGRAREEERQMRQQEAARQQEIQDQQQMEVQQQQAERSREEERQMRQQEAARQQEIQNQQQMEIQQQQAERSREEERQMRQQEAARQQEIQNQQQIEVQQQQAGRAREEERQMRQQEAARQQEIQNQQQMEVQQQQAGRAREEERQMRQQEAARQQEIQNQQQIEVQQQQAGRAREEERQMRQQEAARQQEIQNQQQMEVQQQQEAGSQENRAARRANKRRFE